ncbi:MAG: hypothetical protein MZV64_18985 [Ignavibacteriales bacterium]|nr:hypothetical protein [Ignavibacteriales bacterium]
MRMKDSKYQDRTPEVNMRAVEIARKAASLRNGRSGRWFDGTCRRFDRAVRSAQGGGGQSDVCRAGKSSRRGRRGLFADRNDVRVRRDHCRVRGRSLRHRPAHRGLIQL